MYVVCISMIKMYVVCRSMVERLRLQIEMSVVQIRSSPQLFLFYLLKRCNVERFHSKNQTLWKFIRFRVKSIFCNDSWLWSNWAWRSISQTKLTQWMPFSWAHQSWNHRLISCVRSHRLHHQQIYLLFGGLEKSNLFLIWINNEIHLNKVE